MKHFTLTLLTLTSFNLTLCLNLMAQDQEAPTLNPTEESLSPTFNHSHQAFNSVLKDIVVDQGASSVVDYAKLKDDPQNFIVYLHELSRVKQSEYDEWTTEKKIAFLINAYNAFTLKLIIDHYDPDKPLRSIRRIGGVFRSPWKREFFTLLENKRHLDWIEHEVLRKDFNEPRIHFAVNCASIGCPKLRAEAYVADRLEQQLEEQTRLFLQDSSRNRIDKDSKTLWVSKIFDWFTEDFVKDKGSTVQSYVAPYMTQDAELQKALLNFRIRYTNYDWGLNR